MFWKSMIFLCLLFAFSAFAYNKVEPSHRLKSEQQRDELQAQIVQLKGDIAAKEADKAAIAAQLAAEQQRSAQLAAALSIKEAEVIVRDSKIKELTSPSTQPSSVSSSATQPSIAQK